MYHITTCNVLIVLSKYKHLLQAKVWLYFTKKEIFSDGMSLTLRYCHLKNNNILNLLHFLTPNTIPIQMLLAQMPK